MADREPTEIVDGKSASAVLDTPDPRVVKAQQDEYLPKLKEAIRNVPSHPLHELVVNGVPPQGRNFGEVTEEWEKFKNGPKDYFFALGGLNAVVDKSTNEEKLARAKEDRRSKLKQLDIIDSMARGVFRGATAIATGGAAKGILSKAVGPGSKMFSSTQFGADLVGGSAGDVAGGMSLDYAIDNGIRALGGKPIKQQLAELNGKEVPREDFGETFKNNLKGDLILSGVTKFAGQIPKMFGINARTLSESAQKVADLTDPNRVLGDAMSLSAEDLVLKMDQTDYFDSVNYLRDYILEHGSKTGERGKFFPVLEKRMIETKRTINKSIDDTLANVEQLAIDKGKTANTSVGEILGPVEKKMDEVAGANAHKALSKAYKDEKDKFAKEVLTDTEYRDWVAAGKEIEKFEAKTARIRVSNSDLLDAKERAKLTLDRNAYRKFNEQVDVFKKLDDKLMNTKAISISRQRELKKTWSTEANFENDALRDSEKMNKAASYRVLEDSVRKNLEGIVEDLAPEQFNTYKNLNTYYSKLKDIEPNVKFISAVERKEITMGLGERLKNVFSLHSDGVNMRSFYSAGNIADAKSATAKIRKADQLFRRPATIRKYVAEKASQGLDAYSESDFFLSDPSSIQAMRSAGPGVGGAAAEYIPPVIGAGLDAASQMLPQEAQAQEPQGMPIPSSVPHLQMYDRDTQSFFTKKNLDDVQHVLKLRENGLLDMEDEAAIAFEQLQMGIASGIGAGEDTRQNILGNLIQTPGTAELFNTPHEAEYYSQLKDVNSIVDGKIMDPAEQEKVRQRILKDKEMSNTKRMLILDELNKDGSISGFTSEPLPEPEEESESSKKSTASLNKEIKKAISKKKGVKAILKSRGIDQVIEYSRK